MFPKYIQELIDTGQATVGVNEGAGSSSFIDFEPELTRRGIANSKLEALALGMPVYTNPKGARVTLKSTPMTQNSEIRVVQDGKNIDRWGVSNLARNASPGLGNRRNNARLIESSNMDQLQDQAGRLYGNISQAQQKDTHHVVGINSAANHIRNMPERRQGPFKQKAQGQGFYLGDHPRNLSAIPGDRAIGLPNLHQSVIHTSTHPNSVTALLERFGLPNSTHGKVDLVQGVDRQYNTQREAAALADFAIQRLSVMQTMLGPNASPGGQAAINKAVDLIDRALLNTRAQDPYENLEQRMSNVKKLRGMLRPL